MPADRAALEAAWVDLLAGLGVPAAAACEAFADVAAHYAVPERHYHTLDHVAAVLAGVREIVGPPRDRPALALAAWLHDVVYHPCAADNEERSAAYARALLGRLGLPPRLADETARLILLTKAHRAADDDADGGALLDADLAILGAAPDDYDRYAAAIRHEYAGVPDAAYRAGRARVLKGLLDRPRIYATEHFFRHAEARARDNLRRELAALRA